MIEKGRHAVLGVGIDAVDYDRAVERIVNASTEGRRCTVSALAVHGVMTGALDPVHRFRLNALDLVVPDGQPVRWALRWLHGIVLPDRVYGPNLTLRVLERAEKDGLPVYLYGSTEATLSKFRENLETRLPRLIFAGAEASRFRRLSDTEVLEVAQRIRASGARLALVGLGCPRQEVFANEMGQLLPMPLLAVGAAFDFHAGTLKQAPPALQAVGLEWFYRLIQEPRRLWRRYLYLNPAYVALILAQKLGLSTRATTPSVRPQQLERYG